MTRQVFWYNLFHTPVPYLFHTLWNKGSVPYPLEQEGARCLPETRGFDAHPYIPYASGRTAATVPEYK